MIEKMSKITLLVDKGRSEETLKALRKLGVLHVKPLQNPPSGDMTSLGSELEYAKKALFLLGDTEDSKQTTKGNAGKIVHRILEAEKKRAKLVQELNDLKSERKWYDAWGRISLDSLKKLEKDGLYIKLYQVSKTDAGSLKDNDRIFVLSETKAFVRIALVTRDTEEKLDYQPVSTPETPYKTVIERSKEINKTLSELHKELTGRKQYAALIREYIARLEKDHEFAKVRNGLGFEEEIAYLQGFVPVADAPAVAEASEKNGWGFVEERPESSEMPPTKLKNAKWVRIIQPVFDFLGTVPGYREKDVSMYFLIFFTVFVAMIIGDAGYGSLFFLLALASAIKTKKKGQKIPTFVVLLFVLSVATIFWGAITGTWFGSVAIASVPFFKSLIIPQITSFPELFPDMDINPQDSIMLICFILAVIQLGLASILNFIELLPKLKAFEHIGWFSLTVGLFPLVLNLVLGMDMPGFAVPLIAAGFVFIIFFSRQEPGKNFFKGILAGVAGAFKTFLDSISSFSNIISYIRLFAVGMATVAIASSFNSIAADLSQGPAIIAAVILLLIGHGLNIIMALLSVVVHGIRLNVLEFSGQLGLEWSGYKYQPFKE
ncbi:MAG: V-type ATPase 116kDa subunit family protein [Candidatus Marinimicrobia bacterium]|nr:V-type ATPase 116kDa subunit family protein [Candidatus Neomarinimicrobiota bacterium]